MNNSQKLSDIESLLGPTALCSAKLGDDVLGEILLCLDSIEDSESEDTDIKIQ